jgi:hypothetical protein
MDTKDLLPGQDWELAIKNAIQQADFFIVCLSTQSPTKRGYLQRELRRAQELWNEKLEDDIYLIPLRIDNCEVPQSLCRFQWVDLYDDIGFSRLLKAIHIGTEKTRSISNVDGCQSGEAAERALHKKQYQPKFVFTTSPRQKWKCYSLSCESKACKKKEANR